MIMWNYKNYKLTIIILIQNNKSIYILKKVLILNITDVSLTINLTKNNILGSQNCNHICK